MNLKELVDAVSQETSIPVSQVKKVTTAVLEKFSALIEKEEGFRSPIVRFSTKSLEATEAVDGKQAKPERKVARMIITPEKESD
jgi:nucleoid DNA-binding protein